ncbi:MAG: MBL fold metallo-hydrolase [Anaerolineae bacterium]|nr:MBL fold metallo-hydrolase [Anaerolineae bacterium]
MPFKYYCRTLGPVSTNCYILGDENTGDAVIIDPASDASVILDIVRYEKWTVRQILLTHAHFDHVLALREVKSATGAPILMHAADVPLLQTLPIQMQMFFGTEVPPAPAPDQVVNDGDVIEVGSIRLQVRFTPGHSLGHVVYLSHERNICFCGDCIFEGSIGRTDLPGGDYSTLMHSIFDKILTLPDDCVLAPGHNALTTVGAERASNPFVLDWAVQRR